jgi:hypothetical protein
MLEYAKLILDRVSFDAFLFEHELKKALASLQDEKSKEELSLWCYEKFSSKYGQILHACLPISQGNA